ncbi:hypothetical protein BDB00DRAFT_796324 [Zychaea mexicana]|uniref:uncharacterized protein n=1 Tax=Zychaea mexicana TaxID=64656 RepID=UPI0022FE562C|nr:uncharacterized protein BDB00DRAFT_796324 [Zychaea mexicana]KAI9499319.1 hypothetical protein BDB00DRAFT_796324 [Zychaea mexicana]
MRPSHDKTSSFFFGGSSNGNSEGSVRRQQASSRLSDLPLRGIHINISSDPFQHRIPPYVQRAWQDSRIQEYLSDWQIRVRRRYQKASPLELLALSLIIFASGMLLLIHVGFFSGKKYQDWHYDHYGWLDEVDLLDMLYPDEGRGLTTAVLLFDPKDQWKVAEEAKETLTPLLDELCGYEMFGGIIIWNNNPLVNVTMNVLETNKKCQSSKIQIYNSHSNMHNAGRYLGCSLAKTPYCYFQDHAGPRHWRSLYANFLKYPTLIHAESRDVEAYAQAKWRWCFYNDAVHLHTCHAHVGYGTLTSKETVLKFIELMELDPIDVKHSDMYFITYTNQAPYILEGTPSVFPPFNDEEDREGAIVENKNNPNITKAGRQHVHTGVVSLYNHLIHRTGVFAADETFPNYYEQTTRTPCASDRCLFMTNVEAFPEPRIFSYEPNIDLTLAEKMHDSYYDGHDHHYTYPYGNAVDGKDGSVWKSERYIKAGDYIGLDVLMSTRIPLKFRFLARHPYTYRRTLNIQTSFDGINWMPVNPSTDIECNAEDSSSSSRTPMLECRFTILETGYRFMRMESTQDLDFGFELYDLSFSAKVKRDANGQLLDLGMDHNGVAFVEDDRNL